MANVDLTIISGETIDLALTIPGVQGPPGPGVPSGGATNQALIKQSNSDYDAVWANLDGSVISGLTITNADIVDGAGITDNKLATITAASKVANSATSATSAALANTIVLRDGASNFDAGRVTLTGLTVNGNITVTGSTQFIVNGTDVVSYIEGLPLPSFDTTQLTYSGKLLIGASYPSGSPYDYVSVSYSGDLLSQVDYKLGGVNGGTIATFVVGYSGATVTGITRTL